MSKFRYAKLIEVKEKLLENKQTELKMAISALNDITGKIRTIDLAVEDAYRDMTHRCITGTDFAVLKDYLAYLDTKLKILSEEKKRKNKRVIELRRELMLLATEVKMLEKLRDKAMRTFRKAENRKDQKTMDDIALRTTAPSSMTRESFSK